MPSFWHLGVRLGSFSRASNGQDLPIAFPRFGLGRIPTIWWTLNAKYNALYEIHRLNVRSALEQDAVRPYDDAFGDVRFDFVRSAPDLAAYVVALRTELAMRVVMPEVLPHTRAQPYLTMARFETGPGGNPHFHGFSIGAGGPALGRVRADVGDGVGDTPSGSDDEDGEDDDASPEGGSESAHWCEALFLRDRKPKCRDLRARMA